MTCSENGCSDKAYATGRCRDHYEVHYQAGVQRGVEKIRAYLEENPPPKWPPPKQGAFSPSKFKDG